jgi:choline dehydrogenase-like flavoprotein
MMNNVGGSTVHYAGHWPRYKPVDFRKGTEHGLEGTIDWPISVVWEPHENDIALSKYGIDRIFEATRAVGAVETNDTGVIYPPPGWHLMGTCRMGNNPQDSVTNKWNQTWDLPNLFIVDGSSLTTGGAVNPTSTIGALAVRCGEYIKRRFGDITAQKTTPGNAGAPDL